MTGAINLIWSVVINIWAWTVANYIFSIIGILIIIYLSIYFIKKVRRIL